MRQVGNCARLEPGRAGGRWNGKQGTLRVWSLTCCASTAFGLLVQDLLEREAHTGPVTEILS